MKDIIVKPYKKLPQAELNTFATTISQKMTDDTQFISLKPGVDELKAANATFATAMANAYRGTDAQTKIKNKCLDAVIDCLDLLVYQVNGMANGDDEVALAAGFEVRQAAKPITEVAMPTGLELENLGETGEIEAKWACDKKGVVGYTVQYRAENETEWRYGTYCTSKKVVLTGIASRAFVFVRVCSMGRKELVSGWTAGVGVLVS